MIEVERAKIYLGPIQDNKLNVTEYVAVVKQNTSNVCFRPRTNSYLFNKNTTYKIYFACMQSNFMRYLLCSYGQTRKSDLNET